MNKRILQGAIIMKLKPLTLYQKNFEHFLIIVFARIKDIDRFQRTHLKYCVQI